ncbi:MAG TPA: tetratricopeptide repeat protein [Ignavibacteria bacterium]|nr:tetratricopeptide repeat protein [Ignavibacteria bacterium]
MSEMLGNQYFIARRYADALNELEKAVQKNPSLKSARKKLIICYLQTSQLNNAVNEFYKLVDEDVELILNTDPIRDDCPCPDIIHKMDQEITGYHNDDEIIKLGILWLYCEIEKSLKYFEKVSPQSEYYNLVDRIIIKLQQALKTLN